MTQLSPMMHVTHYQLVRLIYPHTWSLSGEERAPL